MRAAHSFVSELVCGGNLSSTATIRVELFGSLALTGQGHATDRAIILGLLGELPDTVDPASVEMRFGHVRDGRTLKLGSTHSIAFNMEQDLQFRKGETLPGHPNGMRFSAFDSEGQPVASSVYYSVGGGFIRKEGEEESAPEKRVEHPFPYSCADELLRIGETHSLAIWEIALANESVWRTELEVRTYLERIWRTMEECIGRGLNSDGILPGGLKVRRRASALRRRLENASRNIPSADPLVALDWVAAFAMAVNEENASGGRVVTAPTNGAAGIIPAVGHYYRTFIPTLAARAFCDTCSRPVQLEFSTKKTLRSRVRKLDARVRWAWRVPWLQAAWLLPWAGTTVKWNMPQKSAWSITWE
jgi:L-serine dehydratase